MQLETIAPLEGLILDLRDNRGGYLTQAVKVAGLFITNGVVAISRFSDGSEKIYRDVEGKTTFDGPLLILVSRETASAAEIVAQALQDYGVAIVAGDDHTFGKQLLLKKNSGAEPEEAPEEDEDEGFLLKRPQNSGINDIQLDEAIQVMRDMIRMEDGDK